MKIGFIGCGNMGGAILGGIAASNDIIVSDQNKAKKAELKEKYNIEIAETNADAVKKSDIVFLCVKPKQLFDVIGEIKDAVTAETVIVSIVAGRSICEIEQAFDKDVKIIRVMPNTPALVGGGMAAICANDAAKDSIDVIVNIFESVGKAKVVSEGLMDAVTAVSGSSPAYVFMMIEAMADAAVRGGMARDDAYVFAAQAVYGSAKMVLETGMHPGVLKDMVCSPAGTTIDAVKVLEEKGFRSAIMDAMDACIKKSASLN